MKTEKFKVIQFIREFIVKIDSYMDNFPKKEMELKYKIRMNTYELLEIAYEANTTCYIKTKEELLYKAIAKIKVIDFLLNLSYDKKIISEKKYIKFSLKLDDITKYITGWVHSLEKENVKEKL